MRPICREFIAYAIFGVLTTLVNIAAYWFLAHLLDMAMLSSTVMAWIVAVLFAYWTNQRWVFRSSAKTRQEILRELISFFACRVATGILDIVIMYFFVDIFKFDDVAVKTFSNVVVIALNYLGSKLMIFREEQI